MSGSLGRYQSRLLNFVHQQTRRLTQQWDHTFRHLQVASKWSLEILLYPLYQLFHPTELANKTLEAKSPPRLKLQPQEPKSDAPIERVLAAVRSLPSDSESAPVRFFRFLRSKLGRYLPTPPRKFSDGDRVALPINERNIWLGNGSRRITTPPYQVIQGIATHLVSRNLVLVTTENKILDILTPNQQAKLAARIIFELENSQPPWQLPENQPHSQLISKIKKYILATITGISKVNIPALPEGRPNNSFLTNKLISWLDTSVAKWETKALLPIQKRSQEMIAIAQTELKILIYGKPEDIAVNADSLETNKLNIRDLIAAAINYFFGGNKHKKLEKAPEKILAKYPDSEDLVGDSWLDFHDLFSHDPTVISLSGSDSQIQTKSAWLQRSVKTSPGVNSPATTENKYHNLEFAPDWIEVPATFMGYDKHLLEKLLEWLDKIILWLEEIIVKVLQWLQNLWRGK
ncbi:hypothetical protein NWP21_13945 [Anabaenopsis sp. FSS-46]|uniref:hypothetical protein n=1 Tax=Anabaenopsis sp. FSS-46 TaxID=2971766 RepID=UPI0024740908|nr:hypothetical protein [Anabaenopsis sp. FSS-46]MDH6099919.1 hypothetical protein [Anabaenopsis sp. FSS-46]